VAESTSNLAHCQFITDFSEGHCVQVVTQFGDNGPGPEPEILVWESGGHFTWGAFTDRLDSGPVSARLMVRRGFTSMELTKQGGNGGAQQEASTYQFVTGVQIGAKVIGLRRRVAWSSLSVKFFRGGQIVDTITRGPECMPVADSFVTPMIGFRAAKFDAPSSDCDGVDVTGILRIQAAAPPAGSIIAPYDLHSQIRVFALGCQWS